MGHCWTGTISNHNAVCVCVIVLYFCAYYRSAMGILLVFDVTSSASFAHMRSWMRQIQKHAAENVDKVLIGNKSDSAERQVSSEEGEELANEFGISYYETSGKSGGNVNEVFQALAATIMSRILGQQFRIHDQPTVNLHQDNNPNVNNGCC
eukprot:GHVR01137031.1.p1 GENE.GHVR01137031.1~~GHVR01137031.1.p1  ORF type:complete len:151 (+),score=2.84 GHVR01137031.1:231-683(+)